MQFISPVEEIPLGQVNYTAGHSRRTGLQQNVPNPELTSHSTKGVGSFFPTIRNTARTFIYQRLLLEAPARSIRQEKVIKSPQIGKEELKLFHRQHVLAVENSKNYKHTHN